MANKAYRYGYNGGYNAQYNGSRADYTANETAKNVKSGKKTVKVALFGLTLLAIVHFTAGCNVVECYNKTGMGTSCAYTELTGVGK